MTDSKVYNLPANVARDDYAGLLTSLAPFAAAFGLIVHSRSVRLTEHAVSVLRSLEPLLLSERQTSTWPGTELVGDRTSTLYTYRLDPASTKVLINSAGSLFDWVNPALPEDLHLVRADGTTVLGTVAQEEDAWLELRPEELEQWRRSTSVTLRDSILGR